MELYLKSKYLLFAKINHSLPDVIGAAALITTGNANLTILFYKKSLARYIPVLSKRLIVLALVTAFIHSTLLLF